MNTAAIDINTLNDLFDNQKKMDELFDSIFDDDSYFINNSSSSSHAENYDPPSDIESQLSARGHSGKEAILMHTSHKPFYFVLPVVLEIAVFYLIATHLL